MNISYWVFIKSKYKVSNIFYTIFFIMTSLQSFTKQIEERKNCFIGYPHRNDLYINPELFDLLHYHINNIWGPFAHDSTYKMNSREFECNTLQYRAEKYHLDESQMDGYVTTGWTECNQQWLWLAKKNYPQGILYCSQDTHYSVFKAADMMNIETCIIVAQDTGEIDYNDFVKKLSENKDKPAIINLTIGTTVKWASDNLDKILEILKSMNKEDHHIHIDAALSWGFLPFIESDTKPDIWFHKDIKSIGISWHKFIWCPLSCGIFLTRKEYTASQSEYIPYLNSTNSGISWSRSGLAPIFLRDTIQHYGDEWFRQQIKSCLDTTQYLKDKLKEIWQYTLVNNDSITVVFQKPQDDIVHKRSLACDGNLAHAVIMQHVTKDMIDLFVQNIANPNAL